MKTNNSRVKITVKMLDKFEGEISRQKVTKDIKFEEPEGVTWTEITRQIPSILRGLGYVISDDVEYVFENLNSINAKKLVETLEHEEQ